MPLISVIVPVYNVEKYLDRCVKSILRQTYKDFELILVDDGSPDKCPSMCDEWAKKDKRIHVIHQANQGLSAARNAGIRIAEGEYLTFVDSDDWISQTMLEDLVNLILKNDADISICNFVPTDRMTDIPLRDSYQETVYTQEEFLKIILRVSGNRCIHYAWGKLYKKSVIDPKAHYPVGLLNEDVEGMFKAVIAAEKIVETDKIGYFYYENHESISRKKFGVNFLCLHEVWDRILRISKEEAPQYYDAVLYNYKRSDFTILMDMILYGDRETDQAFAAERNEIILSLRKNIAYLLGSPMKMNRKVMMLAVAYSYTPFKASLRMIKKISRH